MNKLTILIFVVFLVISCTSESEMNLPFTNGDKSSASIVSSENIVIEEDMSYSPPQNQSIKNESKKPILEKGSKIIKEGNIHIEVEDLASAKQFIDSLLSGSGAYYEKEIFRNSEYSQKYSLKLRIPSSGFALFVSELEQGRGMILEKNINAKDVTEEYLDLEIRLENNKAYLARYKELLQKARSIEDMIAIQEKIRQIELSIDGNKGRLKYLNDKVRYSTLNIELTTKPKAYIAETPSFIANIKDAFKSGFSGLLYFILILVNLWPLVLGILLIWILRKRMFGVFKKKRVPTN